uniref:Uncharacterized protein n=1 Tax=viral metagenome TaxID=1070528 RepID=A0A6C0AWL4_9ZZZZ|tara:strand:+ start:1549 stop:2034 length:486 start_codon:yes stop_codon:yes gene_type:complete
MSKYIPPHLRKKLEEEKIRKENEEKAKIIVPLTEEAKTAPPPCKWNFKAALTKNNKEFNIPKKTVSYLNYDFNCTECSKPVKREGLNNNGTNYCWYCHSKILFKDKNLLNEYSSDEEHDNYKKKSSYKSLNNKTDAQKLKEMYEDYLYNQEQKSLYKEYDY